MKRIFDLWRTSRGDARELDDERELDATHRGVAERLRQDALELASAGLEDSRRPAGGGDSLRTRVLAALETAPAPEPAPRPAPGRRGFLVTGLAAALVAAVTLVLLTRPRPTLEIDAPLLLSSLTPAKATGPWARDSRDALRHVLDDPLQAELDALSLDATRMRDALIADLPAPVRRLARAR